MDDESVVGKMVMYNQMSANTKNEDFDTCWSRIVETIREVVEEESHLE
jgi:hypothetical protein